MSLASVVVAGASAAGLSCAEALRRKGFEGTIRMIGDEPHAPYDRPPLSKKVLTGEWDSERALLRSQVLDDLGVELLLGEAAVSLDVANRTVHTATGHTVSGDAVVLATGARPRPLPGQQTSGAHQLRDLDEMTALRKELIPGRRLVVAGDGVLGAEIAATARTMGLDVTLAGPQPAPLWNQLGGTVSAMLGELHAARGVTLRLGSAVAGVDTAGAGVGVRLGSGEVLPADVAVVAIGAQPATDWLADSGLRLDDGVVCDARCQAADGIWAAGDVARWYHPARGQWRRLENRTNATEQAMVVADNLLGWRREYDPIPHFWTDQFDAKIQVHGDPALADDVALAEGDFAARRFVAAYRRAGAVTGVVGWNMPKQTRQHRQHLVQDASGRSGRVLST